ncbi:alpha/beta hydrolase [Amycolatopsis japonica]|uniref:alpha/beta hydrolase n=1 Tax=Amycolatopsis japonica TaxID=208439 RepID=UPI0033320139
MNTGAHDWVSRLDEALAEATDPPVLVAHGLGCLTVLHWLAARGRAARRSPAPGRRIRNREAEVPRTHLA